MKKLSILLFIFLLTGFLSAQVNVTVRINTSTNPDTINADNGFIELRGSLNNVAPSTLPDGNTINWGSESTLHFTNVGGDYWEVTFQMDPQDTLYYKAWTGFFNDQSGGTNPNTGWEGDFLESNGLSGTNRSFISGDNDTVLAIQYYHPSTDPNVDPYWRPFEPKADSLAVYFRVSMGGPMESLSFDPAADTVIVRGDPNNSGGSLDWGQKGVILTRESASQHDGSFYSGVVYFDKDSVVEGGSQAHKFVYLNGSDNWEGIAGDRFFDYPVGLKDTTIQWVYYGNTKPTGAVVYEDVQITWRVSTEALKATGLFDRAKGDRIEIRGPNGWDAEDAIELTYVPALLEWTGSDLFTNQEGAEMAYKYYIAWDSSRVDSTSPNFIPWMNIDQGWEEPAVTGGGNRIHIFQKTDHNAVGDFGFQRQFFNGVPANGVIPHDIDVTLSIDMTNATNADSNSFAALFTPGSDTVWAVWDGELTAWSQGMDMWFDDTQDSRFVELTDGDGDMVYEGTVSLKVDPPTFPGIWFQLGYRITYSSAEGYITNGTGGAVFGRRYYQYIHPTAINEDGPDPDAFPDTEWPTAYTLPTLKWTEDDLYVEEPPNLTEAVVSIGKENLPYKFALGQNYPNPFNPTTTIKYSLAKTSDLKITIYNMVGQEVRTLINSEMNAGVHQLVWNGKNNSNQNVASGVYLIKMVAGDFEQTRKMVLIR